MFIIRGNECNMHVHCSSPLYLHVVFVMFHKYRILVDPGLMGIQWDSKQVKVSLIHLQLSKLFVPAYFDCRNKVIVF